MLTFYFSQILFFSLWHIIVQLIVSVLFSHYLMLVYTMFLLALSLFSFTILGQSPTYLYTWIPLSWLAQTDFSFLLCPFLARSSVTAGVCTYWFAWTSPLGTLCPAVIINSILSPLSSIPVWRITVWAVPSTVTFLEHGCDV